MGSYVLQQHPVDLVHMTRITTILRRAMEAHDFQSAVCCLVVLQVWSNVYLQQTQFFSLKIGYV